MRECLGFKTSNFAYFYWFFQKIIVVLNRVPHLNNNEITIHVWKKKSQSCKRNHNLAKDFQDASTLRSQIFQIHLLGTEEMYLKKKRPPFVTPIFLIDILLFWLSFRNILALLNCVKLIIIIMQMSSGLIMQMSRGPEYAISRMSKLVLY